MVERCLECGGAWADGSTCRDYFHQMLFWENENKSRGEVHHLMVLCYHLQHPSLLSAEGLVHGRTLLADFIERDLDTVDARRRIRRRIDSGQRRWPLTARPGNQGLYETSISWTMNATDIIADGANSYIDNVRLWAKVVYRAFE